MAGHRSRTDVTRRVFRLALWVVSIAAVLVLAFSAWVLGCAS